jgi:2-oxoglutarate ferredoxin oxidoreductase subunit delta
MAVIAMGKNKIKVFRGWCKKCGICIAFCPRQVLTSSETGYPVVKDPDRCTGCNLCADRCPDFAITVYNNNKEIDEKAENNDKPGDNNCDKTVPAPGK